MQVRFEVHKAYEAHHGGEHYLACLSFYDRTSGLRYWRANCGPRFVSSLIPLMEL
jgi:hypothetical protein